MGSASPGAAEQGGDVGRLVIPVLGTVLSILTFSISTFSYLGGPSMCICSYLSTSLLSKSGNGGEGRVLCCVVVVCFEMMKKT